MKDVSPAQSALWRTALWMAVTTVSLASCSSPQPPPAAFIGAVCDYPSALAKF